MHNALALRGCALTLSVLCTLPALGAEMYKWIDDNGTVNYSNDPPAGVQAAKVDVREPVEPARDAPGKAHGDAEQEFRQRRDMRLEAEQREQARTANEALARAEQCEGARSMLSRVLASRPRLANRPNGVLAPGERDVGSMNNAERSVTIESLQRYLQENCN